MENKVETKVFTDGIAVKNTVIQQPEPVTIVVPRHVSSEIVGKELASWTTGKILLEVEDLYDPKTGRFLTESELRARGAFFLTTDYHKVLTFENGETVQKGRKTKNPIPYILKTYKSQMLVNINWGGYVNRRNEPGFVFKPKKDRQNGVCNVNNCKAIGQTKDGFFTINGVLFKSLESVKYTDENGQEYPDPIGLQNEFFKKTVKAVKNGKQREADKHGIELKFDPQYRTVRIDSCCSVKAYFYDYKPTDNIKNQ